MGASVEAARREAALATMVKECAELYLRSPVYLHGIVFN
jgi:hypothetical protein